VNIMTKVSTLSAMGYGQSPHPIVRSAMGMESPRVARGSGEVWDVFSLQKWKVKALLARYGIVQVGSAHFTVYSARTIRCAGEISPHPLDPCPPEPIVTSPVGEPLRPVSLKVLLIWSGLSLSGPVCDVLSAGRCVSPQV